MNTKVATIINKLTLEYKEAGKRLSKQGLTVAAHSLYYYLQALLDSGVITEEQHKAYLDEASKPVT